MSIPRPHFLLFSDATRPTPGHSENAVGTWRFVLEELEGDMRLEAEETEVETSGDRLDLLAVIRGLEALDQPSRVTLVTSSRYVARGLRYGLDEWRENDWQWESFGQMTPIRNVDLWRRIDRALAFHQVECRTLSARDHAPTEPRCEPQSQPHSAASKRAAPSSDRRRAAQPGWQRPAARCARWLHAAWSALTGGTGAAPSHAGC